MTKRMMKSKPFDLKQIQDIAATANVLINSGDSEKGSSK